MMKPDFGQKKFIPYEDKITYTQDLFSTGVGMTLEDRRMEIIANFAALGIRFDDTQITVWLNEQAARQAILDVRDWRPISPKVEKYLDKNLFYFGKDVKHYPTVAALDAADEEERRLTLKENFPFINQNTYIGDDGGRYSDSESLRRANEAFWDRQKTFSRKQESNPKNFLKYDREGRDDWRFIPEKKDTPVDYSALLMIYSELADLMKKAPRYSVSVSIDRDSTSTSVPIGEIAKAVNDAIQRRAKLADITGRFPEEITVTARRR